jgi:hypothetical protein
MVKKKSAEATENPLLFGAEALETDGLAVVKAKFQEQIKSSFETLIKGYSSLRVLTYSNSVSLIKRAAQYVDDIEIVFGREDIVQGIDQYTYYLELLTKDIRLEVNGKDVIEQKIDADKMRFYVLRDSISHEKLFLLSGEPGTRVISGSANFSERAFSGHQNESYICFDNDPAAWEYFTKRYDTLKAGAETFSRKAVRDKYFDPADLPVFSPGQAELGAPPKIIVIQDSPPQPTIINRMIDVKAPPKRYSGLSTVIPADRAGTYQMDRAQTTKAVQYIKSNSHTETENPQESLQIYRQAGQVILSGKELNLDVSRDAVRTEVDLLVKYFQGYSRFKGNSKKLARDYFTFMSWLYISPFVCEFRNHANASSEALNALDYPIFGILYGKSNCGKSELVKTLLLTMFQQEGFLPNDWFTESRVRNLREQNIRYPMAFDDLDNKRFSAHAIALIKDDYVNLRDYPAIVLSMNKDRDAFETEIRKRCLIIYTGASLPDHTGESRAFIRDIKAIKAQLRGTLYREYLTRVMTGLETQWPKDALAFSSKILYDLIAEHQDGKVPDWCSVTTIEDYEGAKHDKIKGELLQQWFHNRDAWHYEGGRIVLRLADINNTKKLLKDIPDYLYTNASNDVIVFDQELLEDFLETTLYPKARNFFGLFRRVVRR